MMDMMEQRINMAVADKKDMCIPERSETKSKGASVAFHLDTLSTGDFGPLFAALRSMRFDAKRN
jgi:hypothetical protein